MYRSLRSMLILAAVATAGLLAAETANAQWTYYGPSYYAAPAGPAYSYSYAPYAPVHTYYHAPVVYTRPFGRMRHDVYTPFGHHTVKYRVRPNGRVRVDIDD